MSDAFLPGNGFDTYETQDKVLVSMDGTVDCGVVVRILQQQGFGVAGAVVQLAADQSAWAAAARRALPCGWQQNRPPMRKAPKRQQRPLASSASC